MKPIVAPVYNLKNSFTENSLTSIIQSAEEFLLDIKTPSVSKNEFANLSPIQLCSNGERAITILKNKLVYRLHPNFWHYNPLVVTIEVYDYHFGLLTEEDLKPIVLPDIYPNFVRRYQAFLQFYNKILRIEEIIRDEESHGGFYDQVFLANICYRIEEKERMIANMLPTYGKYNYFQFQFLNLMGVI